MKTAAILDFPIATEGIESVVDELMNARADPEKCPYFVCANPHSLEVARSDKIFARALREATIAVPDGMGVVLALKAIGVEINGRITGSDMFAALNRRLDKCGGRAFFVGSTFPTLCRLARRTKEAFPGIEVCGIYAPSFAERVPANETAEICEMVKLSSPDVLWVGMGAPRQEKWANEFSTRHQGVIIGPVGAVFDFHSGAIKRAPIWVQKRGLEWLVRFLREPRRLWRRTFVSGTKFVGRVIWSEVAGRFTR